MVQMPAYAEMAGRPWRETLGTCTVATLGDVAVIWAAYGIGALASGQWRWGMTGKWNVYATGVLLGALAAIGIEWRSLAGGRWSYNDCMPIVSGLNVGLWPLLQLTFLVPVSWALAWWWAKRR